MRTLPSVEIQAQSSYRGYVYNKATPAIPTAAATALTTTTTPPVGATPAEDVAVAGASPFCVYSLRYEGAAPVRLRSLERMLPSPKNSGISYAWAALRYAISSEDRLGKGETSPCSSETALAGSPAKRSFWMLS